MTYENIETKKTGSAEEKAKEFIQNLSNKLVTFFTSNPSTKSVGITTLLKKDERGFLHKNEECKKWFIDLLKNEYGLFFKEYYHYDFMDRRTQGIKPIGEINRINFNDDAVKPNTIHVLNPTLLDASEILQQDPSFNSKLIEAIREGVNTGIEERKQEGIQLARKAIQDIAEYFKDHQQEKYLRFDKLITNRYNKDRLTEEDIKSEFMNTLRSSNGLFFKRGTSSEEKFPISEIVDHDLSFNRHNNCRNNIYILNQEL